MSDFIDKAQHKAEEIAGEAKEQVGSATGDDELRGRGAAQKVKANAHQAADSVSDAASDAVDAVSSAASDAVDAVSGSVSDAADTATEAASSIADTAAATASDAADTVTDLADKAAAKAREVDVDAVVDTAKSPRTLAIVAGIAGAVVAAVILGRRSRRRRSPQVLRESKRAARALARSTRSKSILGR